MTRRRGPKLNLNVGRKKVDPSKPPRLAEVETEEVRLDNEERTRELELRRNRFGPLRGDVRRHR